MNFYFYTEGEAVFLRARFEEDGTIADLLQELPKGEKFAGLSYDELLKAKEGQIAFSKEGVGEIVKG